MVGLFLDPLKSIPTRLNKQLVMLFFLFCTETKIVGGPNPKTRQLTTWEFLKMVDPFGILKAHVVVVHPNRGSVHAHMWQGTWKIISSCMTMFLSGATATWDFSCWHIMFLWSCYFCCAVSEGKPKENPHFPTGGGGEGGSESKSQKNDKPRSVKSFFKKRQVFGQTQASLLFRSFQKSCLFVLLAPLKPSENPGFPGLLEGLARPGGRQHCHGQALGARQQPNHGLLEASEPKGPLRRPLRDMAMGQKLPINIPTPGSEPHFWSTPFWDPISVGIGEFTTHLGTYFSGDWDVH